MAKSKLKNEFVVSVALGSEWYYILNERSLRKLEKVSGKQEVTKIHGVLSRAKILTAPDHFNLACATIDSSPTMKRELASVMADLILQKPSRVLSIVALAEAEEQKQRKTFLNATYKLDTEELFDYEWNMDDDEEFWTLERLREAPAEKYGHIHSSDKDEDIQRHINNLTRATENARAALAVMLSTSSNDEKRHAVIASLSKVHGYRSLLDMASIIGVHFGDRTYEQGDHWDGPFEDEITTVFDAAAASMRNIDEISKPQTDQGKPAYTAISIRESKEGGIKLIHKSVIDSISASAQPKTLPRPEEP